MRACCIAACIFVVTVLAGCHGEVPVTRNESGIVATTRADPAGYTSDITTANLGKCRITLLELHAWRDWMPVVDKPGPDGGSPLRATVKLTVDNSEGDVQKLSFQATVVDSRGRVHAVSFHVRPDLGILPDAVSKSYRTLDEGARKRIRDEYNVVWNGGLKKGESRAVELSAVDGPYFPVGSTLRVRMTWTDRKGSSIVLISPETTVGRTD